MPKKLLVIILMGIVLTNNLNFLFAMEDDSRRVIRELAPSPQYSLERDLRSVDISKFPEKVNQVLRLSLKMYSGNERVTFQDQIMQIACDRQRELLENLSQENDTSLFITKAISLLENLNFRMCQPLKDGATPLNAPIRGILSTRNRELLEYLLNADNNLFVNKAIPLMELITTLYEQGENPEEDLLKKSIKEIVDNRWGAFLEILHKKNDSDKFTEAEQLFKLASFFPPITGNPLIEAVRKKVHPFLTIKQATE